MTPLLRISLYGLLFFGAAASSIVAIKPVFEENLPPAQLIEEREEAPFGIILKEDEQAIQQLDKEAAKCDTTPPVKITP
ncbi:MAG: hypothetical protein R3Y56_08385, partial [Akkermansia sp.]